MVPKERTPNIIFFKYHKYLHERRKLFRSTHRYHPLNLDTVLRVEMHYSLTITLQFSIVFMNTSGVLTVF